MTPQSPASLIRNNAEQAITLLKDIIRTTNLLTVTPEQVSKNLRRILNDKTQALELLRQGLEDCPIGLKASRQVRMSKLSEDIKLIVLELNEVENA